MNQHRIRCTTPTPNSHPQFFIRRSEMVFDERLPFIESVLATLIKSRFGPDCVLPVPIDLSGRLEVEPEPLYDPCDTEPDGISMCHALSRLGRAGFQVIEAAYRRAKQVVVLDAGQSARNSPVALIPNLGRGSP